MATKVRVTMTRYNVFPWQNNQFYFDAELVRHPQGAGDTYKLRLLSGTVIHLNGNSSDFVAIEEKNDGDS